MPAAAAVVKGGMARVVPIHEHVIEQGFLKFVETHGKGALFYTPDTSAVSDDLTKQKKPRYSQARQRLATWVRGLGVTHVLHACRSSYTLAEAAQATGLNRSTILRAIKAGRISGARDEVGAWRVEPVELHRVFPAAQATPIAVPQHAQADAETRIRLAQAEQRLGELKAALDDMRSQRDAWQAQAERLALPTPAEPPMSFWRWLRTTG
jgi:excisionase family DNA binding protein